MEQAATTPAATLLVEASPRAAMGRAGTLLPATLVFAAGCLQADGGQGRGLPPPVSRCSVRLLGCCHGVSSQWGLNSYPFSLSFFSLLAGQFSGPWLLSLPLSLQLSSVFVFPSLQPFWLSSLSLLPLSLFLQFLFLLYVLN